MKRALVSGSAGFVGRHMVAELTQRGWSVDECDTARSTLSSDDALWWFRRRNSRRYDLVVHAAASAPHRSAIDTEPVHMARNLMLDASMFDWAVRTRQRRVLYLSSSAAYPIELQNAPNQRYRLQEDDIFLHYCEEPDASYGWTKLTGERLAEQARQAGVPVTVLRPFSGYGEDQSENFPFRAFVERARRRENPFAIWGGGYQVRDWIHIDDVVAGALAVAESETDQPVNLCTGVGTSMFEMSRRVCQTAGYTPKFETMPSKPGGVQHRVGDPMRFNRYYEAKIELDEGIHRALKG